VPFFFKLEGIIQGFPRRQGSTPLKCSNSVTSLRKEGRSRKHSECKTKILIPESRRSLRLSCSGYPRGMRGILSLSLLPRLLRFVFFGYSRRFASLTCGEIFTYLSKVKVDGMLIMLWN